MVPSKRDVALVDELANALGSDMAPTLRPPWEQLTVRDAFERHADGMVDPADEDRFFRAWAGKVQPRLGVEHPVVVTHRDAKRVTT